MNAFVFRVFGALFVRRGRRAVVLALSSLAAVTLLAQGAAQPAAADPVPLRGSYLPSLSSADLRAPASTLGHSSRQLSATGGDVVSVFDATSTLQQDLIDVAVRDDFFEPSVVTITVGSAVRWTNRGSHLHSTTSVDGYWNWALQPGASYGVRFLSAGTFDYRCQYHPEQGTGGRVVVLPAQVVTPPIPGPSPTPQPTPQPGELPSDGAIVYDYFADEAQRGQSELYVVEPDGSAPRRLTTTASVAEAQPSWSPDKRQVAYAHREVGGVSTAWRIGVLDLATGLSRPLTAGPADFEPDWHPSAQWVAYTHIEQGSSGQRSELRMTLADGSLTRVLVRLDSSAQVVADPTWAPDGQSLIFTVGGIGGGELYRWRAGSVERIAGLPGYDDIDPTISPDGRFVAYASGSALGGGTGGGLRHDIWLLDLTTGQRGAVATHPDWDLRRPAWSPQGDQLVFTARFERAPDRWALYTVPATGGTVSGPLALGVEPDWAASSRISLPTPMPGPTNAPPPPPPFPTPVDPEPTPMATATAGPPPTFPVPVEPTPTMGATATVEATATAAAPEATPTALPATPVVNAGRIFLPLGLRGVPLN